MTELQSPSSVRSSTHPTIPAQPQPANEFHDCSLEDCVHDVPLQTYAGLYVN